MSLFSRIVQGLPAQVPFVPPEALERRSGRKLRLRLGANESAFGVSPRAREAAVQALSEVAHYCDSESYLLRERLAELHRVTMANVVVGSGIDDLLGLCVRTFLDPGQAAVMTLGSYPTFAYHVTGYGGALHEVPYRAGDDENDPEALLDRARQTGARLLYVANPDNPGGSAWTPAALRRFISEVPDACVLLLDEAYADFLPPELIPPADAGHPRVIRMRTFSKAHGLAGARVAYAIAHADTIAAFDKVRLHFGVNLVAQRAALASLDDQAFVASVVDQVASGRREYQALGKELGLRALPSWTNFVSFDAGSPERSRALVDRLLAQGVFVRRAAKGALARCIRVTVGVPADRAELAGVLRELLPGMDR